MYKATARIFDGESQRDITIGVYDTQRKAEKAGYKYFSQSERSSEILWIQVQEIDSSGRV